MLIPQKAKRGIAIQSDRATPRLIPENQNENRHPYRYLHSTVRDSIIHNSRKVTATQGPVDR